MRISGGCEVYCTVECCNETLYLIYMTCFLRIGSHSKYIHVQNREQTWWKLFKRAKATPIVKEVHESCHRKSVDFRPQFLEFFYFLSIFLQQLWARAARGLHHHAKLHECHCGICATTVGETYTYEVNFKLNFKRLKYLLQPHTWPLIVTDTYFNRPSIFSQRPRSKDFRKNTSSWLLHPPNWRHSAAAVQIGVWYLCAN